MMLRLALATVRHNWPLYLGSFVAVSLGVGLIGGVAMLIASVESYTNATTDPETKVALEGASSLLGVMAGFAGFMAIFVVASTFGFAVAARQRELGLLRLVGATPRQVRRQVRAEALAVAVMASASGCLLGWAAAPVLGWALSERGLAPGGLPTPSPWLPLGVAAGIGVVVSLLGARSAARRASRVTPAQALREAADGGRRIGWVRGLVGLTCLAGAVAMLVLIRAGEPLLALILAIFVPELIVIGLICWGPVLLPALVRLATIGLRKSPVVGLARENVGHQARRTTSMAAPILAISAIAGSLILTLSFAADWDTGITRHQMQAPVVVTGDEAPDGDLPEVGVIDPRVGLTLAVGMDEGDEEPTDETAEGVDPAVIVQTRGTRIHRGDLADLTGETMAVSRSAAFDSGFKIGRKIPIEFADGTRTRLTVVAVVEDAAQLQSEVLVPAELARAHGATAMGTWFVAPADGVSDEQLEQALGADVGDSAVATRDEWIAERDRAQRDQNRVGLIAILGPTGLYAAIAIANTLLMGSLQRRREFAATRLLGATEQQVRRVVVAESLMVAGVALALGAATTATVALLLRAPMTAGLDEAPLTVPWLSLAAIAVACVVVAVLAAVVPVRALVRRVRPSAALGGP